MVMVRVSQGLGNQMFQYAFGEIIKKKYGIEVLYDTSFLAKNISGRKMRNTREIFLVPFKEADLREVRKYSGRPVYDVPFFYEWLRKQETLFYIMNAITWKLRKRNHVLIEEPEYWNIPKEFTSQIKNQVYSGSKNYYFNGFWEDISYIKNCRNFLRERFAFRISEDLKCRYAQIMESEYVSVHIRRGDYISKSGSDFRFDLCGESYYKEALRLVKNRLGSIRIAVFSDDMNYAKELLKEETDIIFAEGSKDYEDLWLMSRCSHNIIANSTFSFWAAFLNENASQIAVAPVYHYFKNTGTEWKKVKFPVLEDWIQVKNG